MADAKPKPLNSVERNALGKLIDNRFKVLEDELDVRRDELINAVHQRYREEAKKLVAQVVDQVAEIQNGAKILEAQYEQVIAAAAKKGIVPGKLTVDERQLWESSVVPSTARPRGRWEVETLDRVDKKRTVGVQETSSRVSVYFNDSFVPSGEFGHRLQQEVRDIHAAREAARRRMRHERLALHEELLLAAITSAEAREFLARVPTLDSLLNGVNGHGGVAQKELASAD